MGKPILKRIAFGTREGYDKQSWIEEANRHLRSAQLLRTIRRWRRAGFATAPESKRLEYVLTMDAAVHSSTLLIAYAFELLLKAGLTTGYVGCSKRLFAHDVKVRFGHNLIAIAREIEYPLSEAGRKQLRELRAVIAEEGRYPFLSLDAQQDVVKRNKRALKFWDDTRFRGLLALFGSVRKHVSSLDRDSGNPAWHFSTEIDDDGYFSFRCGGNLSPRIVVKYSSQQRRLRLNNQRALRRLILTQTSAPLVKHWWTAASYRCVKC